MLSPNPALPGGGLARSNTSMGVYSNLAAHNRQSDEQRRTRTALLPVVKSGDQFKLLQAVKNWDVPQVEAILEDNPNINLRYMDEHDHTVLHYCLNIEKKTVNVYILKLLLNQKSPLNDYGKSTTPVLHMAARLGHVYFVYLLLKHGANIDVQHKDTYRTALHEAVTNGHRQIVELLLYNGADENLREREGRLASDFCRENVFARKDYSLIQELVADNRIDIQEIDHQSITRFTNTRTSARLQASQTDNVPVIVKRQTYESRTTDVTMEDQEDVASDLYTFQSVQTECDVNVIISLPLFEKSCSSRETVVVKTTSGKELEKCETDTDKENMVVTFDANITQSDTFIATSRPTVEKWKVGETNTVLGSVVDEGVRMNINTSTFIKNALVTLQIIELPEDIEIKEGQILASTPFYKIDVDVKSGMNVTVDLPKPCNLGEDGETVILVKVGDYWRVVETEADDKRRTVSFEGNTFPIIASVVKTKTGSSTDTVVTETKDTLAQVLNMTYNICFLCYANRISNTRSFNVVVECCRSNDVDLRRRYWKGQGYQEQTGKDSEFCTNTSSKTGFKLVFYENAISRKNPRIVDLEFHRKRTNIVKFIVELKGKSIQFINGRLFVYLNSKQSGNNFDLSQQPQHLTYIDINLLLNPTRTELSGVNGSVSSSVSVSTVSTNSRTGSQGLHISVRPKSRAAKSSRGSRNLPAEKSSPDFHTDSLVKLQQSLAKAMQNVDPVVEVEEPTPEDTHNDEEDFNQELQQHQHYQQHQQQQLLHENGTDFLDDKMLEMITEELGDDWYKVLVLMGVNFVDIEDEIVHSRSTSFVQRKLFRKWKESNLTRDDCGIPLLLGALFKGGCRNIATMVQIQLRHWHEKWKDNGEGFTNWVTKAYRNPDILVPSDYPKPMTDAYLVLMSDELPPSKDLAHALLIGDSEADDILLSPAYLLDGIRAMKILTMFRDRTQRGIDALETLIGCLGDIGFMKLRNYSVMCAKAWLKRTATRRDDPFRYQVDQLMNKLD